MIDEIGPPVLGVGCLDESPLVVSRTTCFRAGIENNGLDDLDLRQITNNKTEVRRQTKIGFQMWY